MFAKRRYAPFQGQRSHLLSLFISLLACLSVSNTVSAQTFTVNKFEDTVDGMCDEDCSLRDAVIASNNLVGPDTIIVPPGYYALTIAGAQEEDSWSGDLDIWDDVTIQSEISSPLSIYTPPSTFIDGNGIDGVFQVHIHKDMEAYVLQYSQEYYGQEYPEPPRYKVTFSHLTISNGYGSGIWNNGGDVTLLHSEVANNISPGYGGGILNRTFTDVYYGSGYVYENILMGLSKMLVSDSIISNNCGAASGGGIENGGQLTVNRTTIIDNGPKGDCTLSEGGGIHSQYGIVDINNTTIQGNRVNVSEYGYFGGGGLNFLWSIVSINNSTITQNYPSGVAILPGIIGQEAGNLATITNSTIAYNEGDGLWGSGSDTNIVPTGITLSNTILAHNSGLDCKTLQVNGSPFDPPRSTGHNIIGTHDGCEVLDSDTIGADEATTGLTYLYVDSMPGGTYYPLGPWSIAIDAASDEACPDVDQRGYVRRVDGNNDTVAQCDIGAYEYGSQPPVDNQPPVAVAGALEPIQCVVGSTPVLLDGSGSYDPDGDPLTYLWNGPFGTATGPNPTVNLAVGVNTITLTVTDNKGDSSSTTFDIIIAADTTAPIVNAGEDVTLIASGPDGTDFTVSPEVTDDCGSTTVSISPTMSPYPIGTTPVTVTAVDAAGNSGEDTVNINVVYDFGGFQSPLVAEGVYRQGRTLPVKFQVFYANGEVADMATATLTAQLINDSVPVGDPIPVESNVPDSGNTFRFTNGLYIYNLDTSSLSAGMYRLSVDLSDGSDAKTIDIWLK